MIQVHELQIFMHSYPRMTGLQSPIQEQYKIIRHANMKKHFTYCANIFTVSAGGAKLIDQVKNTGPSKAETMQYCS